MKILSEKVPKYTKPMQKLVGDGNLEHRGTFLYWEFTLGIFPVEACQVI